MAPHGRDIELGGLVQAGLGFLEPGLLESLEDGQVLFGLTPQPALLNAEIVDLALVGQKGLGLDQDLARAFLVFGEQLGEFHPAEGKDGQLEGGNAGDAPVGVSEGLDESELFIAHRLVAVAELGEMGLIERGIFGGQQDGAAGEPGFEGVEGGFGLTIFGGRAMRQGAVDAAGSRLGRGRHGRSLLEKEMAQGGRIAGGKTVVAGGQGDCTPWVRQENNRHLTVRCAFRDSEIARC